MRILSWRSIVAFGFFALCVFAYQTSAAAQGWSNGYSSRRTVTIFHSQVPNTDQTNFLMLFSDAAGYLYDGDSKRVAKISGATPYQLYWHGTNGAPLAISDGSGNFTDEYIFFARQTNAGALFRANKHLRCDLEPRRSPCV
jgi:hypothetical protein